jgi:hypothetical protein
VGIYRLDRGRHDTRILPLRSRALVSCRGWRFSRKPGRVVDLGVKVTCVYEDVKIIFVDGKVSDV